MILKKTKLNGPKLIISKLFKDKRGHLREIFKNSIIKKEYFPFDVMSYSKKNVLRGLHIQTNKMQAKIITVTRGKIFDVAVDLRKKSKTFGKYYSVILKDNENTSFYIPAGFAHGFLCLSKNCTVYYKCSNYRDPNSEKTLTWNDRTINISWPVKKPKLSKKDRAGYSLDYFKK